MRIIKFIKAKQLAYLLVGIFFVACGNAKIKKQEKKIPNFDNIEKLISSKKIEIENYWALPLRGKQINLIGNPNFIRFKEDSVYIFLPYFGVRQYGGVYGDAVGISFEGIPENLKIEKNIGNKISIKFEAEQDLENLKFYIDIQMSGRTFTTVNSSQRDNISYRGELKME